MNDDQTLDGATPTTPAPTAATGTGTPFGNPAGPTQAEPDRPAPDAHVRQWTIAEVLDRARRPEKRAKVCLRADLQAEYDRCAYELAGLVDSQGRLIEDDERPAGVESNAARAQELSDRIASLRSEMAAEMWFPLFRGLSSDELIEFNKAHPIPKGDQPDMTEYNTALIAECSCDPKITVDDVRALRQTLGSAALGELSRTANEVCVRGGVDFPQLPAGLARLKQQ